MIFWLIFSILGVNFFAGKYYRCVWNANGSTLPSRYRYDELEYFLDPEIQLTSDPNLTLLDDGEPHYRPTRDQVHAGHGLNQTYLTPRNGSGIPGRPINCDTIYYVSEQEWETANATEGYEVQFNVTQNPNCQNPRLHEMRDWMLNVENRNYWLANPKIKDEKTFGVFHANQSAFTVDYLLEQLIRYRQGTQNYGQAWKDAYGNVRI